MRKLMIVLVAAICLPIAAALAGVNAAVPGTGITPLRPLFPPPQNPVQSGGPVRMSCALSNTHILQGAGGEVFLQIVLGADSVAPARRLPMNLALVIDRSGSMASQNKLGFAKRAAEFLVNNLAPDDRVALVVYDDNAAVLQPSVRIAEKGELLAAIEAIRPGGSTNLSGGMLAGIAQVSKFLAEEQINRVLLLSDGLANRGVVEPARLNEFAREASSHGIAITTLGVGTDYNEDLMLELAEYSGGNYYYIASADSMPDIFRNELDELLQVVAQNPSLSIELSPGVALNDIEGYKYERAGNTVTVLLGDIYSGEQRKVVARLTVPTSGTERLDVAKVKLSYHDVERSGSASVAAAVKATITPDEDKVAKSKNRDVLEKVESNKAAGALERAIRFFESGRKAEAQHVLREQIEASSTVNESYFRSDDLDEQIRAMGDALSTLSAPVAADSSEGKDFRKRQKVNAYMYMQR